MQSMAAPMACWQHTQKWNILLFPPNFVLWMLKKVQTTENTYKSHQTDHWAYVQGETTELPLLEQNYNHSTSAFTCTTGKELFNPFRKTLMWFLACPVLWDNEFFICLNWNYQYHFFSWASQCCSEPPVLSRPPPPDNSWAQRPPVPASSTPTEGKGLSTKKPKGNPAGPYRSCSTPSLAALQGGYAQVSSSRVRNCSISPSLFNHLIKPFVKREQTTKSTPHLPLPWQKMELTFSLGCLPPSHELS